MRILFSAFAATLITMSVAQAADPPAAAAPPPPDFDIAFGAKWLSDYNFRGVSQTDRDFGFQGYIEPKYQWLYIGVAGWSTRLPTRPTGEFDFYGGIRPVFGNLSFDIGATYYFYGQETQLFFQGAPVTPRETSYVEPYAKVAYNFDDKGSLGLAVYHAPNYLNSGAFGTYLSGTWSIALPNDFSFSGEIARYFFGRVDPFLGGINLPEYTYWNLGLTYTVQSTWKFDLRYHQTDLNQAQCQTLTTDPRGLVSGRSRWCGAAIVGTISFDTNWSSLKWPL